MDKQFDEGYDAFIFGKSVTNNPYEVDSQEHENWQAGYYAAFSDSMPEFEDT